MVYGILFFTVNYYRKLLNILKCSLQFYDNPLYSKEVHEKTLFRLIIVIFLLRNICQRPPGYIDCDDSGIVGKMLFFKGLIKDQSLREIIFLFARYPSKQDKIKTSKENNKHVILVHIISHQVLLTFYFLRNVFFYFTVYQMV